MNQTQKEKLKRFMSDKVMSDAVREVLMETILKPKAARDMSVLAAERIALDVLRDAWTTLQRYSFETASESNSSPNLGV